MRLLSCFLLLPLVAFADTMITPAVMVDLYLSESLSAPVVASVDYSETLNAQPTGTVADDRSWFSMSKTVSMDAYVDASDVAKSLDVNSGAILWDTITKDNLLFMVDDPSAVKLLDMEKGMGHVRFEGELTVYIPRMITEETVVEEATADDFAFMNEDDVEVTPVIDNVESSEFINEPTAYNASAKPAAPTRSIEGRLVVKNGLFGKKYMLRDPYTNRKIAKIDKKSPVGLFNLDRYDHKVVILVGTLDDSRKGLTVSVRSVRLR